MSKDKFFTLEELINLGFSFEDSGTSKILQIVLKILISQLNLKNTKIELNDDLHNDFLSNVRNLKITEVDSKEANRSNGKTFRIEKDFESIRIEDSDEKLAQCVREKNPIAEMIQLLNVSKRVDALDSTMSKLTSIFDLFSQKLENLEKSNEKEEVLRQISVKNRSEKPNLRVSTKSGNSLNEIFEEKKKPLKDEPRKSDEEKSRTPGNLFERKSTNPKSFSQRPIELPEKSTERKSGISRKSMENTQIKQEKTSEHSPSTSVEVIPLKQETISVASSGTLQKSVKDVPEILIESLQNIPANEKIEAVSDSFKSLENIPENEKSSAVVIESSENSFNSVPESKNLFENALIDHDCRFALFAEQSKKSLSGASEILRKSVEQENSNKISSEKKCENVLEVQQKPLKRSSDKLKISFYEPFQKSEFTIEESSREPSTSRTPKTLQHSQKTDKASVRTLMDSDSRKVPVDFNITQKWSFKKGEKMNPIPRICSFAPCDPERFETLDKHFKEYITTDDLQEFSVCLKEQIDSVNSIISDNLFFLDHEIKKLKKRFESTQEEFKSLTFVCEDNDYKLDKAVIELKNMCTDNLSVTADIKTLFRNFNEFKRQFTFLDEKLDLLSCTKVDKARLEVLLDMKAEKTELQEKLSAREFQEVIHDFEYRVINVSEKQQEVEENFKEIENNFEILQENFENAEKEKEKKVKSKKKKTLVEKKTEECLKLGAIRCYIADKDGAVFRANPLRCVANSE